LTAADIFNPREAKLIIARDEAAIKKRGLLTEEHPISTKDGLRLFLTRRMTVLDDDGEPQYLIKTHEDVTDRRQTESRMAHMAYHDGLTDLPNRAAFLQALAQMIEACEGTDEEFAVLSCDLDGLKEINDVFGHAVGDKLLIEVSRRIQASARGGVVARLSGDEFGMIIDGKQPTAGMLLAEKLAEALASEFQIDGKSVRTGVTTGISVFPHNGADAASLLANAGAALFRAKAKSRGSITIYEPEMDQQIRDRRVLHQDLSLAIKNGELSLHYQPQAMAHQTVAGSTVIGFEALARWLHPVRGFVPPGDFIPLAEESGLIVEMGEWILREACREAASWPMPLQIAVNLSPAQFMHGDVVSLVHAILLETGLAPDRLELEITEGVLIEDFDRGLALLRRLKALGVRISMDDFGSGYSSLSYLQAFPFDKIKLDRAFVMNLGRNPQSAAIVRAVIGLGHGLEMSIVAEGVETQEQLAFLADFGCDAVQGYFLGKPAPIGQYAALVGRIPGDTMEPARKTG
jgi:diguanylate cyclase (GGDEF)-like protein